MRKTRQYLAQQTAGHAEGLRQRYFLELGSGWQAVIEDGLLNALEDLVSCWPSRPRLLAQVRRRRLCWVEGTISWRSWACLACLTGSLK